jgi:transposase-like protein
VAEQRYRAVLAVISDGRTVKDVAAAVGVSRQTLHAWLGTYEAAGLEGLGDGSHRPRGCPHQMPAVVEAAVLEARRGNPSSRTGGGAASGSGSGGNGAGRMSCGRWIWWAASCSLTAAMRRR